MRLYAINGKYYNGNDEISKEEFFAIRGSMMEDDTPPGPTLEDQMADLKAQNQMLLECLLEMSEIVYA